MPVRNKHYPLATAAGGGSSRPLPANDKRVSIAIQNTGTNPGQYRFGDSNQGPGPDFTLIAGGFVKWDQADTCPTEGLNLSSVLATTWAVMEGVDQAKTGTSDLLTALKGLADAIRSAFR